MDRLKAELLYERRTSEEHLSHFEEERRVWQEEKEKVQTGAVFQSVVCIRVEVPNFTRLRPGDPLPEAAAAELHPDVPAKPGS